MFAAGLAAVVVVMSAAPTSVAAPPWKTVQVPADLAEFYAEHLATALRRQGLKVVTAGEIAALLSMERQRQLLGCAQDATSCVAELGAALGCDATLLVTLAKLEDSYTGTLKLVKSVDGAVLAETRCEASGQKALLRELDEAAERLAQGLAASSGGEVRATAGGARRFWWAPAVAAGAGAALATVGLVSAALAHSELERRLREDGVVTDDAQALAARGQTMQTLGWVGVGVGVAALVGLGALLVFGDAPVRPAVSFGPGAASLHLTWRWP